jgi:Xaa-Pro dipeptidase
MDFESRLAASFPEHVQQQIRVHTEALEQSGLDALAIHSGAEKIQFLDDSTYPFKANPLFKAWAPLTALPLSWLVFRAGEKPRILYYQPDDYWHSPPADPSGYWVDAFDITIIREVDEARGLIADDLSRVAFLGEEQSLADEWGFGACNPDPVVNYLHYQRGCKTDYELACLRRAATLGVLAHRAAEQAFRGGGSEYDIHLAYLAACEHTDNELPYSNIVALNDHGAVLHYGHLDRKAPGVSHSFLIDAGAQCHGYASDITRSYSARDDEFAQLILAMDQAQLRMVDGMRAGVDYCDMHLAAHLEIAGILNQFGVVRLDAESIVELGISNTFFPHGLGHLIGLQVHDVGGFMANPEGQTRPKPEGHPYLRLTRVLQPGFVLTVEPGLYFIESLLKELRDSEQAAHVDWQRVELFYPCG